MKLLKTILDMKKDDFYIIPLIYCKEDIDQCSIVVHLLFLSIIDEKKSEKKKKSNISFEKSTYFKWQWNFYCYYRWNFTFYVLFSFILTELTKKKRNYRNIIHVLKNICNYDTTYEF